MTEEAALTISRCEECHGRFIPRPGPCPRCGSAKVARSTTDPQGSVLASTELTAPSAGWTPPHRLALVELDDSVRVLTIVDGELPEVGARVRVRREGEIYRSSSGNPPVAALERGEGDVPKAGSSRASFEPPR